MLVKHLRQGLGVAALLLVLTFTTLRFRDSQGFRKLSYSWPSRQQGSPQQILDGLTALKNLATEALEQDDDAVSSIYADEDDETFFATPVEQAESTASAIKNAQKSTLPSSEDDEDEFAGLESVINEHSSLISTNHKQIFSLTMANRKYFPIFSGNVKIYNPNIIPHPTRHDLWIVIGQREQYGESITTSEEVACTAGFYMDVLTCTEDPVPLPIEPSVWGKCEGEAAYTNFRNGPRDARVLYGPDAPYIIYGSQSQYSCLGLWLQDLRTMEQSFATDSALVNIFGHATEIQRPPPLGVFEKNFFLFWDLDNKAYVHHDISPARTFAMLNFDGSVGEDLSPATSYNDAVCMTKYMPRVAEHGESIHQATNSLSITMCKRADPGCIPHENNTFVMTIFQHKSYHDFHGIYEPYVMLFQQKAPFAVHGISQRPLWINGRSALTADTHSVLYEVIDPGRPIPANHTEMFYVTSIAWKTHGQRYHGYLDDPLFISFGIEDTRAAAIDVLAEDLVSDLGFCGGPMVY